MHADDTVTYKSARTSRIILYHSDSSPFTEHWMFKKKTVSICLSIHKQREYWSRTVTIQNEAMSVAENVKYSGIVLDSHLRLDKTSENICTKGQTKSQILQIHQKVKYASLNTARLYVHAMISSHCVTTWARASLSTIRPITSLRNHTIKTCTTKTVPSWRINVFSFWKFY